MFKASALMLVTAACSAAGPPSVTFTKDVLPILQARCQACHRAGEVGPFSLLTYKEVRPLAKSIKESVITRRMPPWFADPTVGHFSNDRSLTQREIETLVAWVAGGAKQGDPKDAPTPRKFFDGWQIGQPDVILELPKPVDVPAEGVVDYTYVVFPTGFAEDKWVQFAEVRPSARSVVHHVVAFIRPPGSTWMKDAEPGVPYIPARTRRGVLPPELLVGYAPGLPPAQCRPGQAKLIKAGSDIVLQLHYTPNGKAMTDQTRIGLIFAKEPVEQRVMTMSAMNVFLKIPPGEPNYESHAQITLKQDVKLVALMPHMHYRGKDFEYRAVYPSGETQVLLRVPHYDFNWQLGYVLQDQLSLPKGTRIECTAHHDNSANNKYNPDPTKEVRWGDQTWEEMMIGWFDVAFDAKLDPAQKTFGTSGE